ncbi:MAG TPA: ABC-type transport auxiliary lipoprotein family protein [Accumulibacter sp.]|nr:ABC-type transport auxiliary lipoprotein family protein [Accumulibacter sp.]HMW17468.1 ABC-type transport auxiliary lipoprotein family protein [Accumulibacter sp.]HMX21705.1 ABC-type transport auxiliary lipoprotein family protein [Accumulibacter sp.]HMY06312.1 ABC-type transport auxiliary lipoprotein family protein [Accumulibacter sp.]HNC17776.1 ABC-type transport auxiliary lipoprotein family protein [Accumulibacter sp.]
MKKSALVPLLWLLVACADTGRAPAQSEVYDFGLPTPPLLDSGPWSTLALEVKVPNWLDTTAVAYRLLYDDPLKWRSYAHSRWAASPSQLLGQRLRHRLALVGNAGPGTGQCVLRVELQMFSQIFVDPQSSRGELHGTAQLSDSQRRVVAEHRLTILRDALSADARGGVSALVATGDELTQQLAEWLNDAEKRGSLNDCRMQAVSTQAVSSR